MHQGYTAEDIDSGCVKMSGHVFHYGESGIASTAISRVDMALRDIRGKVAGKLLYDRVGGLKKDRQLANASAHGNKKGEAACVAEDEGFFAAGFRSTTLGSAKKGERNIDGDPDTDGSFIPALVALGATRLATMQPHAMIVNSACGQLIIEQDLADALTNGIIAGAALDVFHVEHLPADNPLPHAPDLLLTRHAA